MSLHHSFRINPDTHNKNKRQYYLDLFNTIHMNANLKEINIGQYIEIKVNELNIPMERICSFLKKEEVEVLRMYSASSLDSDILLRWSKLLKYDFFRLYSQHLILYAPSSSSGKRTLENTSVLPEFRKSIYTKEVIDFIISLIKTKEKTTQEIISEYKIPKTTLYKWISKYKIEN